MADYLLASDKVESMKEERSRTEVQEVRRTIVEVCKA